MRQPTHGSVVVVCGVLIALSIALCVLGLGAGSSGWHNPFAAWHDVTERQILLEIRAPRTLGAWLVGALLGLSGAVAQGLFRNPLAEPYLLGSSSGATLALAMVLSFSGQSGLASSIAGRFGVTGLAFVGALGGVALTLFMARGASHTLRLLLSGVVVGVVLGALTSLMTVWSSELWRTMQSFMLGNTGLLGWSACAGHGAGVVGRGGGGAGRADRFCRFGSTAPGAPPHADTPQRLAGGGLAHGWGAVARSRCVGPLGHRA
jgi:iron complex transport system permease protein